MSDHKKLAGVIPPVATPFDSHEQVDEAALRRELAYLRDDAKVHGFTMCGSTGEGYALNPREVRRIAEIALEEAADLPVVIGVIANATRLGVEFAGALRGLPIAAIQAAPVHYIFNPGVNGHAEYFDRLGEAAAAPVVIYNVVPWANLSLSAILAIRDHSHWICGVKQSARDLHKLAALVPHKTDAFCVLSAVDDLLMPSFVLGADGTIGAIPMIAPALSVSLWNAVKAGDLDRAVAIHERLLPVWHAIDAPDMPSRLKSALRLEGRPMGPAASPYGYAEPDVEDNIAKVLARLDQAV